MGLALPQSVQHGSLAPRELHRAHAVPLPEASRPILHRGGEHQRQTLRSRVSSRTALILGAWDAVRRRRALVLGSVHAVALRTSWRPTPRRRHGKAGRLGGSEQVLRVRSDPVFEARGEREGGAQSGLALRLPFPVLDSTFPRGCGGSSRHRLLSFAGGEHRSKRHSTPSCASLMCWLQTGIRTQEYVGQRRPPTGPPAHQRCGTGCSYEDIRGPSGLDICMSVAHTGALSRCLSRDCAGLGGGAGGYNEYDEFVGYRRSI